MGDFHDKQEFLNLEKLKRLKEKLPAFVSEFFVSLSNRSASTNTIIAYAYDYILYFEYLITLDKFKGKKDATDFNISDLELVSRKDIEFFISSLSSNRTKRLLSDNAKARKIASLRSLYNYFQKNEEIRFNPAAIVSMPQIHKKNVVTLNQDEVQLLLDKVKTGAGLSDKAYSTFLKTKERDYALLMLLFGTGLRVSELVGLDIGDVDFHNASLRVIRKGGDEDEIYFGSDVEIALFDWINIRRLKQVDTNALFLSIRNTRLSVRSVETIVKKYGLSANIGKRLYPHRCRSTYATHLYEESDGDIYMVKDALHHSSLETSKHYIGNNKERKRKASQLANTLFEK